MGEISLTVRQRAEKLATRDLIEAVGGFEPASLFCRLGKSQLHRCCDLHSRDFLPIDVVSELEAIAGRPIVTVLHARQQERVLVALPAVGAVAPAELCAALAIAIKEFSDVSTRVVGALTNGRCAASEARGLIGECTESAEAVIGLRSILEQIAAGDA